MGRSKKVTKKVIGSAGSVNGSAARGAGVVGSAGEFAEEGMGLQGLLEVAGGGSGEENNVVGDQDPHLATGRHLQIWFPTQQRIIKTTTMTRPHGLGDRTRMTCFTNNHDLI
jgi:hypothetical protein